MMAVLPAPIYYTIRSGTRIYHSTDMTLAAIKELVNGTSSLKVPAYFKLVPTALYGGKTLAFEANQDIVLLDMGKLATVRSLYGAMVGAGEHEPAAALLAKSKAVMDSLGAIQSIGASFATVSDHDKVLAEWLRVKGYAGWRMPFAVDDEVMLCSTASLQCKGKNKG